MGMFDENFMRFEDFDTWLRMSFAGARMAFHEEAGQSVSFGGTEIDLFHGTTSFTGAPA